LSTVIIASGFTDFTVETVSPNFFYRDCPLHFVSLWIVELCTTLVMGVDRGKNGGDVNPAVSVSSVCA
jgi:hypothetical protein